MTEPINLPELWTPLYESLVKELGRNTASVYGAIWRFCQMRENVCRASIGTVGARIGMSRRSVIRHVKILVENGYLTDLTPGSKNTPHAYATSRETGIPPGSSQAGDNLPSRAPATEGSTESDRQAIQECQTAKPGVTGHHTGSDKTSQQVCQNFTPGVTEFHSRCDKTSQQVCQIVTAGVTNWHTNKTLLRESLRDDLRDAQAPNFSKPSKTLLEALNRRKKERERNGNRR